MYNIHVVLYSLVDLLYQVDYYDDDNIIAI